MVKTSKRTILTIFCIDSKESKIRIICEKIDKNSLKSNRIKKNYFIIFFYYFSLEYTI